MPLLLIGAGVAVLVGILAFVLLTNAKKPAPAPAPAAVATPATPRVAPPVAVPGPPQAPQPAPPAVAPAPAAPDKTDGAERRARAEQRRKEREEAQAREDKARAEREARDREAKAQRDRAAGQQAAADDAAAERDGGLTQAQIEGVLRSTKPAFDGCIQAARGTDVTLDGRRVMLRLNIQTSGSVTNPALDDPTLNASELGSCLKSATRLMVFPKFKGDAVHVEVPMVMR